MWILNFAKRGRRKMQINTEKEPVNTQSTKKSNVEKVKYL